jgi:hypothetical protein
MKKPHVHAEIIKAWADGATIQYYNDGLKDWFDVVNNRPSWNNCHKYRVKPEVKSDAELLWIAFGGASETFRADWCRESVKFYEAGVAKYNRMKQEQDNV